MDDGRWELEGATWIVVGAASRSEALSGARAAIAAMLKVSDDAFDVVA